MASELAFSMRLVATLIAVISITVATADLLGTASLGINCPIGLISPLYPCDTDCREQHNSSGGACNAQHSCICSGPPTRTTPMQLLTSCNANFTVVALPVTAPICACLSNATPLLTAAFEITCETDCRCNHGAASGTCDYDVTQCNCNYPEGFVWSAPPEAVCLAQGLLVNATICLTQLALTGTLPDDC